MPFHRTEKSALRPRGPFARGLLLLLIWGLGPLLFPDSGFSGDTSQIKAPTNPSFKHEKKAPGLSHDSDDTDTPLTPVPQQGTESPAHPNPVLRVPDPMPPAEVGRPYRYSIQAAGGCPPHRFRTSGNAPPAPGLVLRPDGRITGVPLRSGTYGFQVRVRDSCPSGPRAAEARFVLRVRKPELSLEARTVPDSVEIPGDRGHSLTLTFVISRKPPAGTTPSGPGSIRLESEKGRFLAGKRILAEHKRSLALSVHLPGGQARETVRIPASVRKRAREPGAGPILYTRTFQSADSTIRVRASLRIEVKQDEVLTKGPKDRLKPSRKTQELAKAPTRPSSMGPAPRRLVLSVALGPALQVERRLRSHDEYRIVDSFVIKSLKERALVLETRHDPLGVIPALRNVPGVLDVQPEVAYETLTEPDADLQATARILGFSRLHPVLRGQGVRVAILDTGVDIEHRDLEDRVRFQKNLIAGRILQPEIHGTAVAGLIGAGINGYGIAGIAPESDLLALRCLEQVSGDRAAGRGTTPSMAKALDLALENQARVVNLSFGTPSKDRLISRLLDEGDRRGILFTAAVGNRAGLEKPLFPASHAAVISVAGQDSTGRALPSRGLASRARVTALSVRLFTTLPENRHGFQSGTSMASAVVAGILALGLERRPGLKRQDLPRFQGSLRTWTEELLGLSLGNAQEPTGIPESSWIRAPG